MNNPKISIVIPVYNSSKYLSICIASIINQTYDNLDIIIVNDGSTDNSISILEKFKSIDNRIRIVNKSQNQGIGNAYKDALKLVKGEYVSFVDSDDYLDLNCYASILSYIKNDSPDIVYFKRTKKGKTYHYKNYKLTGNSQIIKYHYKFIKDPSLGCKMFHVRILRGLMIYSQNIGIDEIILAQALKMVSKAYYIDDIYYFVNYRENSVSRAVLTEKKVNDSIRIHKFLLRIYLYDSDLQLIFIQKYLNYLISVYQFNSINYKLDAKIYDEFKFFFKNSLSYLSSYSIKSIKFWIFIISPYLYRKIKILK